jgi:hypothetical protein
MSDLFNILPTTKEKVNSVITKLKAKLGRNPTEDEIASHLNINKNELWRFIKVPSSETRYFGSSLANYNRPSGSIFDDEYRYERSYSNFPMNDDAFLYNDKEKMRIIQGLSVNKKIGGRRKINSNKHKKKRNASRNRYGSKKNKKSIKRK